MSENTIQDLVETRKRGLGQDKLCVPRQRGSRKPVVLYTKGYREEEVQIDITEL